MINTKSIRFRLSVWYAAIFSIAMAVVFISFYAVTRQSLLSNTDSAITSHTDKIVEIISQADTTEMDKSFVNNSQEFARQFSEMPGMLLVVGDTFGNVLYTSQNLGGNEKVVSELLEKSVNIIKPTFVNRAIGDSNVRLGVFPAQKSDEVKTLVIMGQPMDVIQNALDTLAFTLSGAYVAVFLLTIVGGFMLAGRAMNPIRQFSKELKKISANNLQEQVPNPQTGDELEELSHTFNGLLDHLKDAFARERQFIGDVAHELKTPLATLITRNELDSQMSENLVELKRLSDTVNDVLELARMETGQLQSQFITLDLSQLSEEIVEILDNLAQAKKIRIVSEITPNIKILGSRSNLFRALYNLIENAIKFTPVSGKIAISLSTHKNEVVWEISNSGSGISEFDLPHVFDRFYRGQKNSRPGTGLGLAICKSIITAHHGNITVKSQAKKLTTFEITLPIISKSS